MEANVAAQEPVDIHEPFTKAELLQQLADIDGVGRPTLSPTLPPLTISQDISSLLTHASTAIQSLAQPIKSASSEEQDPGYGTLPQNTNPEDTIANLDTEGRLATFSAAKDAFLTTLHSVDVRLKRQVWALEEAGIITLKGSSKQDSAGTNGAGADKGAKVSLQPDGVGKVGGLDVGWLNARSNKIERDMESELWNTLRKYLEDVAEGKTQVGDELFESVGLGHTAAEGEARDANMDG